MQMLLHFFNYWTRLQTFRRIYLVFVVCLTGSLSIIALMLGEYYKAFVEVGVFMVIKAAVTWALVEFVFLMAAIIHIGQMSDIELPEDLINYEWEDRGEEEQGNE